jgi:hypothetical protein
MNSNNDVDDFGAFDQEEEAICCSSPSSNYLMVQNISALAGKLQTSLTVSDTTTATDIPPPVKEDDHVIVEAIAQWEALCQRENNPAYQISSDVMDTVEYNREKICEFYYGIVDSLDTNNSMDRRIVAIAMSYLKRYVERCGKSNFNLLLMTSLFLAMKTHCNRSEKDITYDSIMRQCKFYRFPVRYIARMEEYMMEALGFHLNPPVSQQFVDILVPIIENCDESVLDPSMKHHLHYLSYWMCEISVLDSFFTGVRPSSVAYAAILVAMTIASSDGSSIAKAKRWLDSLGLKDHDDDDDDVISQCHDQFLMLFSASDDEMSHDGSSRCLSPTDVLTMPFGS